jgi:hypothetical protein
MRIGICQLLALAVPILARGLSHLTKLGIVQNYRVEIGGEGDYVRVSDRRGAWMSTLVSVHETDFQTLRLVAVEKVHNLKDHH